MRRHYAMLTAVCLAVFTIHLATTIINIALPTMTEELDADTRDLLWIVDGFNLAFAALVLAMGSLSDRFGRRRALLGGLAVYAIANVGGAFASNADVLVGWRVLAGIGAAMVYPATLSILVHEISDRRERAIAIGLWGAASGVAVAVGPILGGALLENYRWGSVLVFCAGLGALSLLTAWRWAPNSADPSTPPLDRLGLLLSTVGLGVLVHAIIEGPERGWSSQATLAEFSIAAVVLGLFVVQERRVTHPMLDVRLFANMRFTAASTAVTFAFFALFGFIFLITQYFQFVLGYGALEAGTRMIPVALAIAVSSIIGTRLAVAAGTKSVVAAGLLLLATAFLWISTVDAETSYLAIAAQMLILGTGLGLTTAPATEAIMGVVPVDKAGVGSAVNDATRELGGTLGVAIIGSVAVSVYAGRLRDTELPADITRPAEDSLGAATAIAHATGNTRLADLATSGFLDGLAVGCIVAMAVCLVGAALVLLFLPAHPHPDSSPATTATASHAPIRPQLDAESRERPLAAAGRPAMESRDTAGEPAPKTLELPRAEPTADTESDPRGGAARRPL